MTYFDAIVDSVNADQTVNIIRGSGGPVIPDRKVVGGALPVVGEKVWVVRQGADMLVLGRFAGAADESLHIVSGAVGLVQLDVKLFKNWEIQLVGDVTIQAINGTAGFSQSFTVTTAQDSLGGHLVTWDPQFKWTNGVVPDLPIDANSEGVFTFLSNDDLTTVKGFPSGGHFA